MVSSLWLRHFQLFILFVFVVHYLMRSLKLLCILMRTKFTGGQGENWDCLFNHSEHSNGTLYSMSKIWHSDINPFPPTTCRCHWVHICYGLDKYLFPGKLGKISSMVISYMYFFSFPQNHKISGASLLPGCFCLKLFFFFFFQQCVEHHLKRWHNCRIQSTLAHSC